MMRRLFLKLFRRHRLEQDLEAELAFHREMAASRDNPIPFGNAGIIREQAYDLWRFNGLENLWRDLVFAVRTLWKSQGFACTALLSLGLGIGVNTAIFSIATEFLLSEPSVRGAKSVVYVQQGGNSHMQPEVLHGLRRSGVFEDVAGESEESFINFNDGTETRRIFALEATKDYFTALGVPVAQGRGWFATDPDEVVVLNAHFWRARLGGDPAIVGKSMLLDGRHYTVLGILPENYRSLVGYGYAPDVFVPKYIEGTMLAAYARMKPGMTIGQLNAVLPVLGQRLDREFPSVYGPSPILHATAVGGMARLQTGGGGEGLVVSLFFVALLAVAGLVLIIACVNVANLLLARGSVRRQEIAIRLALGAGRGRLLQQLLAESLLLSGAGAALGFLFALATARAAAAIPLPFPVPIRLHIDPDWRVAAYAAVLAVVAAVACGLMPAWQSVEESLSARMHRQRKQRARRILVVAQIAVSFVVLTTAVLFLQNLARSSSLGPGFDIRRTIRAEVYLPPGVYKESRAINLYVGRALEGLEAIPGIESAAAARIIPFTDNTTLVSPLSFPDTGEKRQAKFYWNAVTPGYFRAMDIRILMGGAFTPQDNGAVPVAIVNDVFVRQYLAPREPIGTTFVWGKDRLYRIVGVVRATKNMTIGENPVAQLYEPLSQIENTQQKIQFVARSATPPATQLAGVRQTLRLAEPAAGLKVETLFSGIGFAFLPSQVGAALMGSIGALGLLLAVIGLYGVLAYSVARRTREIGIRLAIGASPGHVSKIVLGEFFRLLAAGIAIGLVAALLVTRPLAIFFVPGLTASDPASFAVVIAVLAGTGALAAPGPLRRALGVDPLRCLRYE
jgi:predicted permease